MALALDCIFIFRKIYSILESGFRRYPNWYNSMLDLFYLRAKIYCVGINGRSCQKGRPRYFPEDIIAIRYQGPIDINIRIVFYGGNKDA